jgi:hypothetical protein
VSTGEESVLVLFDDGTEKQLPWENVRLFR